MPPFALVLAALPQTSVTPLPGPFQRLLEPRLEFGDFPFSFAASGYGPTVGARLLTRPSEGAMQVDLNGDGDLLDQVIHAVDLSHGAYRSLDLSGGLYFADGTQSERAICAVHEAGQAGDQNGDGDTSDWVLFGIDPLQGGPRNAGLAGERALVSGDLAALDVSEIAQGAGDLNGDGRLTRVLYRWDLASVGAPVSTGMELDALLAAHAGYFLFQVFEQSAGVDRNGDGDTSDRVLFVLDGHTGGVVSTGLALELTPFARGQHSLFFVSESKQGSDLNGDGDQSDQVIHAFDLAASGIVNLGLALGAPSVGGGHSFSASASLVALGDDSAAFHVSEPAQGGADLNGDGDALDVDVLHVHRFAGAETRNLGLSAWNFALDAGRLAFQVNEAAQGAVDLDGDGTHTGYVVHVHELATETTWNTGVAAPNAAQAYAEIEVHGRFVAFRAGPGLTPTLTWLDCARRRVHPTGLALDPFTQVQTFFQPSGTLAFGVPEWGMGLDLDGDGDTADQVLHLLQPGSGQLWNTGAPFDFLVEGVRQVVPFLANESHDGRDHNGDGDALDQVLRTVRLRF